MGRPKNEIPRQKQLNLRLSEWNIFIRCVLYSLVITAVEFSVGVIVNIILGLDVWDYSSVPGNILGQVCPSFTLLWMVISVPAVLFSYAARGFFDKIAEREERESQNA